MASDKEHADVLRELLKLPLDEKFEAFGAGYTERALDRAIELLDPATVTSESEREHCEKLAEGDSTLFEMFMRERAAARSECERELDAKHAKLVEVADKLAALRAEHERLKAELERARDEAWQARNELSAHRL